MSKETFIHAENNNKILSSNEVRLYVPPEPEKMKVIIWGKELCNGAEWYDFLKRVEEKTEENDQLKQQLAEKDKEIAHLKEKDNYHLRYELAGADETITNLKEQLAEKDCRIEELEGQFAYECECNKQLVELQKQLEKKQNEIAELEQELTELKEKAIARPKFEHFEECWYIENNPYCDNELQVFNGKVMEIICAYDEDWLYEYRFDTSCRYIEEDNIFATEQEALEKLKEIQGNE